MPGFACPTVPIKQHKHQTVKSWHIFWDRWRILPLIRCLSGKRDVNPQWNLKKFVSLQGEGSLGTEPCFHARCKVQRCTQNDDEVEVQTTNNMVYNFNRRWYHWSWSIVQINTRGTDNIHHVVQNVMMWWSHQKGISFVSCSPNRARSCWCGLPDFPFFVGNVGLCWVYEILKPKVQEFKTPMNSDVATCFFFPSTKWISPNISITAEPDHEGREEVFPSFWLRVSRIFPSLMVPPWNFSVFHAVFLGLLQRTFGAVRMMPFTSWTVMLSVWFKCAAVRPRWSPLKNQTLEICQHATAPPKNATGIIQQYNKHIWGLWKCLPSCTFKNINPQYPRWWVRAPYAWSGLAVWRWKALIVPCMFLTVKAAVWCATCVDGPCKWLVAQSLVLGRASWMQVPLDAFMCLRSSCWGGVRSFRGMYIQGTEWIYITSTKVVYWCWMWIAQNRHARFVTECCCMLLFCSMYV